MDRSLGNKIKQFRKRAGLSQFDLEIQIGASPGSLSRIENGQINPTKETLVKIANKLELKPYEYTILFNLEEKEMPELITSLLKINSSLDLEESLQNSVDAISSELNLTAAVIFTTNDLRRTLHSNTLSKGDLTGRVMRSVVEVLGKNFNEVEVSLDAHKDNLLVRTVNERKSFYTKNLRECTIHAYPEFLSNLVSKIIGFKCAICFPIIFEEKCIGSMFYVSAFERTFQNEKMLMEAFTKHIGVALGNARKYQSLQNKLLSLQSIYEK